MRGLPQLAAREAIRVRRWDAIVLGGALPGLIAGVRLAMQGARILVLEEDEATRGFAGLREPFLMTGSGSQGVLGPCLRALGVSMLARQRVELDPIAYQIALPNARIDIAEPDWTAEEIESWGLASGAEARQLVASLVNEAEEEAVALLRSPIVRATRRIDRLRSDASASNGRSSRAGASTPPDAIANPRLAPLFEAQVRALCGLARTTPPAAARTRLLGAALGGSARMATPSGSLARLLRERIESLFGSFRTIGSEFDLVSTGGSPAVVPAGESDVLAGRVLLVNAPLAGLRSASGDRLPRWLRGPEPTSERHQFHYVGERRQLPPGMASRVICVRNPEAPMTGANTVTLQCHARSAPNADTIDLVASVVAEPGADTDALREQVETGLGELMPYTGSGWRRVALPRPTWDREGLLCDLEPGKAWPHPASIQPNARMPIHVLDRSHTAALGFEGDLLLGWRAGDAIAPQIG